MKYQHVASSENQMLRCRLICLCYSNLICFFLLIKRCCQQVFSETKQLELVWSWIAELKSGTWIHDSEVKYMGSWVNRKEEAWTGKGCQSYHVASCKNVQQAQKFAESLVSSVCRTSLLSRTTVTAEILLIIFFSKRRAMNWYQSRTLFNGFLALPHTA